MKMAVFSTKTYDRQFFDELKKYSKTEEVRIAKALPSWTARSVHDGLVLTTVGDTVSDHRQVNFTAQYAIICLFVRCDAPQIFQHSPGAAAVQPHVRHILVKLLVILL